MNQYLTKFENTLLECKGDLRAAVKRLVADGSIGRAEGMELVMRAQKRPPTLGTSEAVTYSDGQGGSAALVKSVTEMMEEVSRRAIAKGVTASQFINLNLPNVRGHVVVPRTPISEDATDKYLVVQDASPSPVYATPDGKATLDPANACKAWPEPAGETTAPHMVLEPGATFWFDTFRIKNTGQHSIAVYRDGNVGAIDGEPRKLDVTNRVKAVEDALAKAIGIDDSRFNPVRLVKRWAETESVVIEVKCEQEATQ